MITKSPDKQNKAPNVIALCDQVLALRGLTDAEKDLLEELKFDVENDKIGKGHAKRIKIREITLANNSSDDEAAALDKIEAFLNAVKATIDTEHGKTKRVIDRKAGDTAGDVDAITQPLVPGKDRTYWRDINAEVVKIAKAFHGTPAETQLKDLRKASHNKQIGKEDVSIIIGKDVLELWEGDSDEKCLLAIAKFVEKVKRNNPDKFPKEDPQVIADAPDKIFWRDVVSGIDALATEYPDAEFINSLAPLREMLDDGEVGHGMHLFITVGTVHLWIQQKDNDELIKEKIAVFIGELKQIASNKSTQKEAPLDPKLDKTYWRDILGALEELEPAYGKNRDFKLLKLSIEKGTLGTVKSFKTQIDGVTLDIRQSDSDADMKDKLTRFIRALTKEGEVKIKDGARKKYADLEEEFRRLEREKLDLESRYTEAEGDLRQKTNDIRRLMDENRIYEGKIARLKSDLQSARDSSSSSSSSRTTSRSYSG